MELNENYRIITDENNVILQFFETREKENKKDGSKEPYEFTDNFYYPTIKTALRGFLNKSIKPSTAVEDCLYRIEEVENIIKSLKF